MRAISPGPRPDRVAGWDVDLAFSKLNRAQLQGVTFGELHGYELDLGHAVASRSVVRKGWLKKASLTGTYLHGARWNQALLEEANLDGAQLQGAELKQSKFMKAQLHATDFSGADVHEADFRKTPISNFDNHTLQSLLETKNQSWRTARFEDEVRIRLQELDQAHGLPRPDSGRATDKAA